MPSHAGKNARDDDHSAFSETQTENQTAEVRLRAMLICT